MTANDQDYALVVGINDYPRYASLKGAIADAEDLCTWLLNTSVGGGLPATNLRKVTSTADPSRPLQLEIDEKMQEILDQATQSGGGRRLYFYFGGHGFANGQSDVALCLAAWSKIFRSLAISSRLYRDAIADHGVFREIIVLLDCCRTREVAATGLPPTNPRPAAAAAAGQTRFFIANATESGQSALEAAVLGTTPNDAPLVRGHFTRALLAALWGGAATNAGGVSGSDLKRYLERETPLIAGEVKQSQKPEILDGLEATAVFGSALPTLAVEIVIKAEHTGDVVLEGPTLNEVRRGPASTSPWIVELTGGMHMLRDLDTSATQMIPFRPAQGRQRVEF